MSRAGSVVPFLLLTHILHCVLDVHKIKALHLSLIKLLMLYTVSGSTRCVYSRNITVCNTRIVI